MCFTMARILFSLCLISCFFWAEGKPRGHFLPHGKLGAALESAEGDEGDHVDRIINGQNADKTSHPYMVSLVHNQGDGNEGNENCGGNGENGEDGVDSYHYNYGGEDGGNYYYYDMDGTVQGKRSKLSARVPKPLHGRHQHNRRRVKAQTQSPHFCGGALIAPQWVLTAGHCVGKEEQGSTVASPADMSVKIAEYDLSKEHETNEEKIGVTKIVRHQSYNPQTTENDIALLKLSKPVDISKDNIATLALPSRALTVGEMCTLVGWGTTQAVPPEQRETPTSKKLRQGGKLPNILQEAKVKVLSQDVCANAYSAGEIKDTMVCASDSAHGKDHCYGDSGGPLINIESGKKVVSGIVSFAIGCGQPAYPGVYTRVYNFNPWITQTMQANP